LGRTPSRPSSFSRFTGYPEWGFIIYARLRLPVLVEGALRFFHGTRYELHAWVVILNHVWRLWLQRESEPVVKFRVAIYD
jgi:hypothetical protein